MNGFPPHRARRECNFLPADRPLARLPRKVGMYPSRLSAPLTLVTAGYSLVDPMGLAGVADLSYDLAAQTVPRGRPTGPTHSTS
jgi:hypothetical protein